MYSWVLPVLGWAVKCIAQGHFRKKKMITCGSSLRPPGYESHILPLSHAGSHIRLKKMDIVFYKPRVLKPKMSNLITYNSLSYLFVMSLLIDVKV